MNDASVASTGEWARTWFAPLGEARTWRAAGYLCVGLLASWVWFAVTLVALVMAFALVIAVIGIPLVMAAFWLIARLADIERSRAELAGLVLKPRPLARSRSWLGAFGTWVTDRARWLQVGYMLSVPFVSLALFIATALTWFVVVWAVTLPLSGGSGLPPLLWLPFMALGVLGLGAAPRITVFAATGGGRFAESLLSPSRVEEMQERVEELTIDRSEIFEAVARERRRIERNLHDGVQQRLVALGIDLGLARSKLPGQPGVAAEHLDAARDKARTAIGELRVIGRGLHPAILEDRGLDAALSAVVAGAPLPIRVSCNIEPPLPSETEETAYFVASEAVGNILKHSRARAASIDVAGDGTTLTMTISDDGSGGATLAGGTGLAGMAARVRGHDGNLEISSPEGGPTVLRVQLPYETQRPDYRR